MLGLGHDPTVTRVLCLGAHSDDIELGAGGTILRMLQANPALTVYWVVFSASPERAQEAQASAEAFLAGAAEHQIVVKDFRDGFFPYLGMQIKEYFEELKREFVPDLIFTHYRDDLHQDHRLLAELTWNTWRNHQILEYEIPKYEGDLAHPNLYVHIDEMICRRKIQILQESFTTQRSKQWFTAETFSAVMRLRGIESNAPGAYAEAFHCRKLIVR